ncbi:MAG: glycosyltransferase family 4 protein [Anaerolineae bacterium]|nr:glycosyltransferase family 4 protein [Anaerolineae bacterium]
MRILLISGEFPPMQGGVGDYTREMARAWVELGHQVWVLGPCSIGKNNDQLPDQSWHILPLIRNWKWGCWAQITRVISQIKPDIVNIQYQAAAYHMRNPAINLLPWRLKRLKHCPRIVVTYHDLLPPYLFPKAGRIRHWAVRLLARHSDAAIVTNTEDLALAQAWPFATSATLFQIPIGSNIAVDPPRDFDRDLWRTSFGYTKNDFVWAYFGFLSASKGGETLIRALAQADGQTHLLMIGGRVGSSDPTNQAYANHIERLIDELGLRNRVQWTGYVAPRQVSAALLGVEVLVLPYRDGISFRRGSLHAALAHGCAVISTTPRIPLPELRNGENMLLVPPDDIQAVYEAAESLHRDPGLRARIGQEAQKLARQFTWEEIARRTVDDVFCPQHKAKQD